jgi:hypothetical protein
MTGTNEAANGQTEITPPEATPETTRKTTTRRQTKSAEKAGLVKAAPEQGQIFLLDDNTRISPTDYLPNHRPIALSDFEVVGTLNSAGIRPIMANTMEVFSTDLLPGHRPVAMSTLHISEISFMPGRPIADNDDVDPPPSVLMGYLD